jgi:hypothetical protein
MLGADANCKYIVSAVRIFIKVQGTPTPKHHTNRWKCGNRAHTLEISNAIRWLR